MEDCNLGSRSARGKYGKYTIKEKRLHVVTFKRRKLTEKISQDKYALENNIPRQTLTNWLNDIDPEKPATFDDASRSRKNRKTKHPEAEKMLIDWYKIKKEQNFLKNVTLKMMQYKFLYTT